MEHNFHFLLLESYVYFITYSTNVIDFRQKVTNLVPQGAIEQIAGAAAEEEPIPAPTVIHSCQRTGCMAAFESFSDFESAVDEILDLVEDFSLTSVVSPKIMEAVESGSESQSTSINVSLSVDDPLKAPEIAGKNLMMSVLTNYL